MIKNLKLTSIQVTPFVATRDWTLSNTLNDALILLEQTGSDGEDLAIAWERIIYGDGLTPYTSSQGAIALEQQNNDDVIYQEGISGSGLFFPESEPINANGTYKRMVYTTIHNMFYNDYKDPTKIWGLENIDLHRDAAKKFIGEKIRSFMIPQANFGEKILEESVQLIDNSLDNEYEITDDGFSNLYARTNLFSRFQELGDFNNLISGSFSTVCDYYVVPTSPSGAITLSGSVSSSATFYTSSVILLWNDLFTGESGFNIYRKTGSVSFAKIGNVVANTVTYTDTTVQTSSVYDYYVAAFNSYGESTGSNIFTPTIPTPVDSTLYFPDGTTYLLGPYDLFEEYDSGSSIDGLTGGFGWESVWDVRTAGAPEMAIILAFDDMSSYASGSTVSGSNDEGEGWGGGYE